MTFKVGDKVVCIKTGSNNLLELGKHYTIESLNRYLGENYCRVSELNVELFFTSRFELAPTISEESTAQKSNTTIVNGIGEISVKLILKSDDHLQKWLAISQLIKDIQEG